MFVQEQGEVGVGVEILVVVVSGVVPGLGLVSFGWG